MPPNAIEPISMSGDARAFFKGGAVMVPSEEVIHYPFLASMFEFRVISLFLKTDRGSLDVTVRINDEIVDFTGANGLAVVNSDGSLIADDGALDRFDTTSSSALNFTVPDPDDHPLGRSELSMEFSNISSDAPQMLTFQFWLRRTALHEEHVGELIESGSIGSEPGGSFSILSVASADYPWREATTSPLMSSWNLDNFTVSTLTAAAISATGTEQVLYVHAANILVTGTYDLDTAKLTDFLDDEPAGRVVMLNVEGDAFNALRGQFNSSFPTLESVQDFFIEMVEIAHEANSGIAVGIYNLIQQSIPWTNAKPIADVCDVLFPSVYWSNSRSQEEHLTRSKDQIEDALDVAAGRPVIPVILHRFAIDGALIYQPTFLSHCGEFYNHQNVNGDSAAGLVLWGPDVGWAQQGTLPDIDSDLYIPSGMSLDDYIDEHSESIIYNLSNELAGTSTTVPWPLIGSVAEGLTPPTVTHLRSFSSTDNVTSYDTGSQEIVSGQLYYLDICNVNTSAVGKVTAVNGDAGLIQWSHIATSSDGVRRKTLFVGVGRANGTITSLAIEFGLAQLGCSMILSKVDGALTTNNGEDSVLQPTVGSGNSATPFVQLAAFSDLSNCVYGSFAVSAGASGVTFQPDVGYEELDEEAFQQPITRVCSIWYRYNDETPGVRLPVARDYVALAVEIASA